MWKPLTGLWTHPDFMKLWFGQTISEFGSRITRGGLPLIAVLTLNATPAEMGLFGAIASLPVLMFGLFAGVMVDRVRRRPLMIICDVARLLILLTIPLAALTGTLSMTWVYVVAALTGLFALAFDAAYRAYLPSLISRENLLEGNTKLGTTDALAEVGGPAITGVLVQIMTAPAAILLDALSYVASVVSLSSIRTSEALPPPKQHELGAVRAVFAELREGVHRIATDPILRTLAVGMGGRAFFGSFFGALYDLYVVRVLGLTPVTLGVLIAGGGIGALIGSLIAGRVHRRLGIGQSIGISLLVSAGINFTIPLAAAVPSAAAALLLLGQIVGDAAMMIFWINDTSLRQMRVPDYLLGRVNAGYSFLAEGVAPVGALAAGFIATVFDTRFAMWIAVLGILAVAIGIALSPVRRLRSIPSIMEADHQGV